MTDTLHIGWGTGYLNIYMKQFFPCSATDYKKLLKLIDLYGSGDEHQIINDFFRQSIADKEQERLEKTKEYWEWREKELSMQVIVNSKKLPNGLPIRDKEQLKFYKEYRKEYGANKRACERKAKKAAKDREWFQNHAVYSE